jgi:hypothetical protein
MYVTCVDHYVKETRGEALPQESLESYHQRCHKSFLSPLLRSHVAAAAMATNSGLQLSYE